MAVLRERPRLATTVRLYSVPPATDLVGEGLAQLRYVDDDRLVVGLAAHHVRRVEQPGHAHAPVKHGRSAKTAKGVGKAVREAVRKAVRRKRGGRGVEEGWKRRLGTPKDFSATAKALSSRSTGLSLPIAS